VVSYTYDAYGQVVSVEGNQIVGQLNPIRYKGYYYDVETSLYYLQSRYYNTELCRFISPDDIVHLVYNKLIKKLD
jgi:RHS repeat-associated protein